MEVVKASEEDMSNTTRWMVCKDQQEEGEELSIDTDARSSYCLKTGRSGGEVPNK